MRKELNNRLIGLFVIVAFALAFGFVSLYGIGKYFREHDKFVMYFTGSLEGLQDGAPVKFRGVTVGQVIHLRVQLDRSTNAILLPVLISIETQRIAEINEPKTKVVKSVMSELLAEGLHAKLQVTNLVTGARHIELDTTPNEPIKLVGEHSKYIEIPTLEPKADQLSDLVMTANKTLTGIDKLIQSDEVKKSIKDFDDVMIASTDFMISGKESIERVKQVFVNFDENLGPTTSQAPDTLRDFSDTLAAIRVLADYLTRHPESLLTGKGKDTSKR